MKKLNNKQVEGDGMLIEAHTIEMHQNESEPQKTKQRARNICYKKCAQKYKNKNNMRSQH
jgi:hypothetical protein